MKTIVTQNITFGRGGNAEAFQGEGWSHPEQGATWAVGPRSSLRIPTPFAPHGFFLEIDALPFVHRDSLPVQRVIISIDGREAGRVLFRWVQIVAIFCNNVEQDQEFTTITIEHPDARPPIEIGVSSEARQTALMFVRVRVLTLVDPMPSLLSRKSATPMRANPSDSRALITEAETLTAMSVTDFVSGFEQLVGNCEFGFFQRQCGAEPLGLMRFAAAYMRETTLGIDSDFEGLGEKGDVEPILGDDGTWFIRERRYRLVYHTFIPASQTTSEQMIRQETVRLNFLRRMLMENMALGRKTFVCRDVAGMDEAEVLALFLALNRKGPCRLLWVTEVLAGQTPGAVERQIPGLIHAYIHQFAPRENPADLSVAAWLTVCLNAWHLSQNQIGDRHE